MKNVTEMQTKDLIAEYNQLTGKSIKKFTTRAVAEASVLKAREAVKPAPEPTKTEYSFLRDGCPKCGATEDQTSWEATESRVFCHKCSTEYYHATGKIYKASTNRSEAIAKTWQDKAVYNKRIKRDGVTVDGIFYRSAREAFKALELPLEKHIQFRIELKKAGQADFKFYRHSITAIYTFKIAQAPLI